MSWYATTTHMSGMGHDPCKPKQPSKLQAFLVYFGANFMALTQEQLKSCLSYNPESGEFIWISRNKNNVRSGRTAGHLRSNGYIEIRIKGKSYLAHRLAFLYVLNELPESSRQIDHINGNRMDNRISNLRLATPSQNLQNQRTGRGRSKMLGAIWDQKRNKWVAQIKVNGKRKYLGMFETPEGAHSAYLKAKKELHEYSTI
ncbi:HNH endonuclease [Chitinibacter bivalviorum]|uniref:HNH endonuclease n=1 Tax=Chitinibacter bivalviorum TaxID=2739434 RepID=A0A7H9BHI7_9NEIS|nr:HNH endonuclease [Chitinibacter bivalviorum]QLG87668.1 HNH endonuclease [Chitinibacter bivalviorum]